MTEHYIDINKRRVGKGYPTYIVAEMSANHNHSFDQAVRIMEAAKSAGADAIKIQTYTPDTLTIDCDNEYFQIKGTLWDNRKLYELYDEAYMPWDWQPRLQKVADALGMDLFSTPFDFTAVDFLENMNVPVHKIASFECVDLPLLRKIAATGKPIIMSTGMATLTEIDEAVRTLREAGCTQLALLKCTSAYPSLPEDMNLRTIPDMEKRFGVPVGLSDHTLGIAVPVAAVALGACVIEKHFTLSRSLRGPDSAFSLEPAEFKAMVEGVRITEKALGSVRYEVTEEEAASRAYRRSLFVVHDVQQGQVLNDQNIRSIRPAHGLHTRHLPQVLGKRASRDIEQGTPLSW